MFLHVTVMLLAGVLASHILRHGGPLALGVALLLAAGIWRAVRA